MLSESELNQLRSMSMTALGRRVLRFVEIDPRVALRLISEVEEARLVQRKFENPEVQPASANEGLT